VIDAYCKTNYDDIYGAGDVTGKDLIWPVAAKEGMAAALNMTGKEYKLTNFFEKKATINLFNIPAMTFGMPNAPDDTYKIEVKEGKDHSYQKLIYKEGKICGAILQKEMYYTGILNQIKYKNIDMSQIHKPLLDVDYADLLILSDGL
jgi:NAD(P)H-nitrite reductase large subunit